jgi:ABC-2 type transport system permease protein
VRALTIAWKDIRHTYRSVAGVAMMLVAPLLLALALGSAFGNGDSFSIAAVKTVVVNQDQDAGMAGDGAAGVTGGGTALTDALSSPDMAELLDVELVDSPEEAKALVDDGDAHVAVLIPEGLTAALMSSGAGGAEVQIYRDPSFTIGPGIVTAVVRQVTESLNGARAAAAASVQLGMSRGIADPATLTELATAAAASFAAVAQAEPPVSLAERSPQVAGAREQMHPNVASQVLVGMMLFFMLFGASVPAQSIINEHRDGTLPRLFTTPTPRGVILGGKYISVFLVVLIQSIVLVLAGRLLLGADWGEPGPLAALILCSALMAASVALFTVSFARTPAQAGAVSSAIFVFLGLVSGNFTGTADVGALSTIRRISPMGWMMEGWTGLLFGGSWGEIALPVLACLGFTVVLFGVATFFFRRRYA